MTTERINPLALADGSFPVDGRTDGLLGDILGVVDDLTTQVSQLTFARDSNRRIGMALGIVMRQHHLGEQEAFDALRRVSQNTNRKLRDVAEDVIQRHGL